MIKFMNGFILGAGVACIAWISILQKGAPFAILVILTCVVVAVFANGSTGEEG